MGLLHSRGPERLCLRRQGEGGAGRGGLAAL